MGRLAVPVARRFYEVRGRDVAPMLERLVENPARLVVQHVPDIEVIRG